MKRTLAYFMPALLAVTMAVTSCSAPKDAPDQKATVDFVAGATSSGVSSTSTATYTKSSKTLAYTLAYSGFTPTAVTLNQSPAGPGTSGPAISSLSTFGSGTNGTITLNQAQENALMEGRMYFSLQTRTSSGNIFLMRKPYTN